MQDTRIDGMGTIAGGEYGSVKVSGMGKCTGDLTAQSLSVSGKFTCQGKLKVGKLTCSGTADFGGDISAASLSASGRLVLGEGCNLEAQEVRCSGYIRVGGQISADLLKAEGAINAREVVGDQIQIISHSRGLGALLFPTLSTVGMVEATTVSLSGVRADTVSGQNVTIGPRCDIGQVDCSGTLSVHRSAKIGRVTGDCVRQGL